MTTEALLLATYGRVSSDSEEQLESFKAQEEYYTKKYENKPGIDYVGHFADEGISGKFMRNREELQNLLKLAFDGKVKRIVTKSVSRFARNMIECLQMARNLKNAGVTILFETQGIDTADESAFVILGIMASMAEEEIRTLSRNVAWGFRKRYAEGQVNWTGRMLGYIVNGGKFTIVPEEAVIVREIFEGYLAGKSYFQICQELVSKGVVTIKGKSEWREETIDRILTNEKYIGDVILQKTYAPDIMLKRRLNINALPKYEIQNNHDPIITRELFGKVQAEIGRRRLEKITLRHGGAKHTSKYPFSGKLVCQCGSRFRRFSQTFKNKLGEKQIQVVWVCLAHQKDKTLCEMKPIKEDLVEQAFLDMVMGMSADKDTFKRKVSERIDIAVTARNAIDVQGLGKQLEEAQQELIAISQTPLSAGREKSIQELMNTIRSLQSEIELAQASTASHNLTAMRLTDMKKLITRPIATFNDNVFNTMVDRILITSQDTKPNWLKFILANGSEVLQAVA